MRLISIILVLMAGMDWNGGNTADRSVLPMSSQPTCSSDVTPNIHFDECERRCRCVDGKLVECTRLRKEFTAMSDYEKRRYIEAIKAISKHPKLKPTYDSFLFIHKDLFAKGIHTLQQFLPWHRWYVHQYENLIRSYDCRLTVPYWDWSLVSSDPWKTTEDSLWYTGLTGLGGDGSANGCVKTGPFKEGNFNLIPAVGGGCLTRNFNGYPHDPATVQHVLDLPVSRFFEMEVWIRATFHNNIHNRIGGIMADDDASSAPEFFLHHAILDKVWKDWQDQSLAHKYAYFPWVNIKLLRTRYRPMDYVNSYALPGGDRVEYVNSEKHNYVFGKLKRAAYGEHK